MKSHIRKWGNSLGVRIPAPYAKNLGLVNGSSVELKIMDNQIIIKPQTEGQLEDMLQQITTDNLHHEQFSDSVGHESL